MATPKEIRKCIVSGEAMEKENLLRFALTPDRQIVPDFKKKISGTGIYVGNSKSALAAAIEKNLFSKVCKKKVKADEQLITLVENLLKKRGLELVSLSRKAGILLTGFEKVCEAVKKDKVAFIMEASDAGADGNNRILSVSRGLEIFNIYSVEELDKALNKVNTVHIAFKKSDMAKSVRTELIKIKNFLNS